MRIVIALGGNALLRRGEPMTTEAQRRNIKVAAGAIAPLAAGHSVVVAHGNGPQVGLLASPSPSWARGTRRPRGCWSTWPRRPATATSPGSPRG
jgi:carbamate kinase